MICAKHLFHRRCVFLKNQKKLYLQLIPAALILSLIMVSLPISAQVDGSQRHTLSLVSNNIEYKISVNVPMGWSITPERFKNTRSIINAEPGESKQPSARIQVYVEPRLDHADALKQIREFASMVANEDKVFAEINGWPAVRITRPGDHDAGRRGPQERATRHRGPPRARTNG